MGIHRLYQPNLFATPPALDLLLAINRDVRIGEGLAVGQPSEVVAASKDRHKPVLVLEHATCKVSGHSGVQNVRPRPIGHNVNATQFGSHVSPYRSASSR